ncbi:hypothetical protein [Microbacterium sp.]|uniref:hypothetical protein n=1 Tax=Microbacterium sp. TaxID=51671 RepID=UPI002812294E|nr:hypothetical protein [Microbacterium sp.]
MITVQQILFTGDTERWWALAEQLGFRPAFEPTPEWAEFDAGGVLAVHATADRHPANEADLHLLVDDLEAAERRLGDLDVTRSHMDGVGELLTVRARSGVVVTASAGARRAHSDTIAVQPIWFQPDVGEARAILEAFGLRAHLAADRGGWIEMHADGGGTVGIHSGEEAGIGRSFVAHDLDALAACLADADFPASVIDEAHGRSLRILDPDGGQDIWVNGVQDDLYGYHRVS